MSFHNLSQAVETIRVLNSTAAGTTSVNTSSIDLAGQGGVAVRFVALIGALTATQVTYMKIQDSDDNSTWNDVAGSKTGPMADTDSNKMLVTDVYKPKHRYVRAVVVRGTANAAIDGVVAEVYHLRNAPSSVDTSVSARTILSTPADGTP